MKITTYDGACEYLESFVQYTLYTVRQELKEKMGHPLDRMRHLLLLLNNPQEKFKSVLVGGTSGKGSTAYFISHILTTAGYKTGFTLSPHLVRFNERIQINNKEISDEDFTLLVASVSDAVESMKDTQYGLPSYFEITIAMAFLYFAKVGVDIAVVEVGMGGEFDATNVLIPLVVVLTNVSLDHTAFLGDTVEKIAKTKAGIIKNGTSVVITGVDQPSVIQVIEQKASAVHASVYRLGRDFQPTKLPLSLQAEYQKENASLAIEAVLQLQNFGFSVFDSALQKALSNAYFPGRFEVLTYTQDAKHYTLLLDGAHNMAKMQAFINSLKKVYFSKKKVFLIAFKEDKDIQGMVNVIQPLADAIVITQFSTAPDMMPNSRAMSTQKIRDLINKEIPVFETHNTTDGLKKAYAMSNKIPDSILVVTGSLYLVGEIKAIEAQYRLT